MKYFIPVIFDIWVRLVLLKLMMWKVTHLAYILHFTGTRDIAKWNLGAWATRIYHRYFVIRLGATEANGFPTEAYIPRIYKHAHAYF